MKYVTPQLQITIDNEHFPQCIYFKLIFFLCPNVVLKGKYPFSERICAWYT